MTATDVQVRLYAWRMRLGLTLEQASARTGKTDARVSTAAIGRAETGATDITLSVILKIIDAYGLTPAEFFGPAPAIVAPTKPRRGRPRKLSPALKRAGAVA